MRWGTLTLTIALLLPAWAGADEPVVLGTGDGVRLVVMSEPTRPLLTAAAVVGLGDADAPEGLTGGAHLLEHLVFERRREPGGPTLSSELRARGCRYGAWTWPGRTVYEFTCPASAEGVGDLLLETLVGLRVDPLAGVTDLDAVGERGVVTAELNREEGDQRRRVARALRETMHRREHPMVQWARRQPAHVHGIELLELAAWGRTAYAGADVVVALAGAWDPADARTRFSDALGGLTDPPAASRPEQLPPPSILQLAPDEVVGPGGLPRLYIGWQLPLDVTGLEGSLFADAARLALARWLGGQDVMGLRCAPSRSGLDALVLCQLPFEPDAPEELPDTIRRRVQRAVPTGPTRELKTLVKALRGPAGPAAMFSRDLGRGGGDGYALRLATAVFERGTASQQEALLGRDGRSRLKELEEISELWMAAARARYLVVRPGDGPGPQYPPWEATERPTERLESDLWRPVDRELPVASRHLADRLDAVAVQLPGELASVSLRYPTGQTGPGLVEFLEHFAPPKRRIAEHRGVMGGASFGTDAVIYRAWSRSGDLGRAMAAVQARVLGRRAGQGSVERWLGRRATLARLAIDDPTALSGALVEGWVPDPDQDPMEAVLDQLDRYRTGDEGVLAVELMLLYDARRAELLVVGPAPPEQLLDEAERRLAPLARFGLPFDLEAAEAGEAPEPVRRWLVPDPDRAMVAIEQSCELEAPERGSLVLEAAAELVRQRLVRRFRAVAGLAYAPGAWIDGDGDLHRRLEVPAAAVPDTLEELTAAVVAPAEGWEVDEARLRLSTRLAPELHSGATLPLVLMRSAAGTLPAEEIERMVPLLEALGPADLDAALAGCEASTITVVQGPADSLTVKGFMQLER